MRLLFRVIYFDTFHKLTFCFVNRSSKLVDPVVERMKQECRMCCASSLQRAKKQCKPCTCHILLASSWFIATSCRYKFLPVSVKALFCIKEVVTSNRHGICVLAFFKCLLLVAFFVVEIHHTVQVTSKWV